jgi:hypothetical protein
LTHYEIAKLRGQALISFATTFSWQLRHLILPRLQL